MDIIELLTPAYEAAWLPWAVQYFFLIGIAATAALLAAWLAFGNAGSDRARLLPAVVTDRVRPGTCFVPFHWNDEQGEHLRAQRHTHTVSAAQSVVDRHLHRASLTSRSARPCTADAGRSIRAG